MTKTENNQLFLVFTPEDNAEAKAYEFTQGGAIYLTDKTGNHASISFHPDHIPAIEHLLNILYAYRGDYDDVMPVHMSDRIEVA